MEKNEEKKAPKNNKNKDADFLRMLHKDRTIKLKYLHEQHQIAIAVYNAKKEMLISEIDVLENHLNYVNYSQPKHSL